MILNGNIPAIYMRFYHFAQHQDLAISDDVYLNSVDIIWRFVIIPEFLG